jgi:hypothetical protein
VGFRAARLGQRAEVGEEVADHLEQRRHLVLAARHVGIRRSEQLLRQGEHPRVVALRETQDREDHLQRVRHRDVTREVALPAEIAHPVDRLGRQVGEPRLEAAEAARQEPVRGDARMTRWSGSSMWINVLRSWPSRACRSSASRFWITGRGSLRNCCGWSSTSSTSACFVSAKNGENPSPSTRWIGSSLRRTPARLVEAGLVRVRLRCHEREPCFARASSTHRRSSSTRR